MIPQKKFTGFPAGKVSFTPVPDPFFTDLLTQVDDLAELKVILYLLWALNQREGDIRYLVKTEMLEDKAWLASFSQDEPEAKQILEAGIQKAVQRGAVFLLHVEESKEEYYLINTPRSRSLLEAYQEGKWQPGREKFLPVGLDLVKPNVFKLYEQNIGALTPMMAEYLKAAENDYPLEWIEEAFRIAVVNNVRKWNYIQAILRSWQERGRDDENRRDTQEGYRKYLEGEYARFIEH